jgi:hypothetical protein
MIQNLNINRNPRLPSHKINYALHFWIVCVTILILCASGCQASDNSSLTTIALKPNMVVRCSDASPKSGSTLVIGWGIFYSEPCKINSIEFKPANDQEWIMLISNRGFPSSIKKSEFSNWKHTDYIEKEIQIPSLFNLSQAAFLIEWRTAKPASDGRHFITTSNSSEIPMYAPPPIKISFSVYLVDNPQSKGLLWHETVPSTFLEENPAPLLQIENVKSAKMVLDSYDLPTLLILFSSSGSRKLEEVMNSNTGRKLVIVIDDTIMAMPIISGVITDGKLPIQGLGYFVIEDIIQRIEKRQSYP